MELRPTTSPGELTAVASLKFPPREPRSIATNLHACRLAALGAATTRTKRAARMAPKTVSSVMSVISPLLIHRDRARNSRACATPDGSTHDSSAITAQAEVGLDAD